MEIVLAKEISSGRYTDHTILFFFIKQNLTVLPSFLKSSVDVHQA